MCIIKKQRSSKKYTSGEVAILHKNNYYYFIYNVSVDGRIVEYFLYLII